MERSLLDPIWKLFQLGCDSWQFVAGLLVVAAVLSRFDRTKPYVSGFVFPAFLLFFRKIALYIPLIGALSTEDQIIFWSTGAFCYFVISLLAQVAILITIWVVTRELADGGLSMGTGEALPGLIFGFLIGSLIGSTVLL
ncbi:MAG: hypothetical protein ACREBD_34650, partial [Blastocatellia bacterium]